MKVIFIEERANGKRYGFALSTNCKTEQEVKDLVFNVLTEPTSKIVGMAIK